MTVAFVQQSIEAPTRVASTGLVPHRVSSRLRASPLADDQSDRSISDLLADRALRSTPQREAIATGYGDLLGATSAPLTGLESHGTNGPVIQCKTAASDGASTERAESEPEVGQRVEEPLEEETRFSGEAGLKQVAEGSKTLTVGDRGPAVRRIQEALHDLDFVVSVHGLFTEETASIVRMFQKQRGLAESGKVDQQTYDALEAAFATKQRYAEVAKTTAPGLHAVEGVEWSAATPPGALTRLTRTLTPEEQVAAQDALSPAQKVGGVTLAFKPEIGKVKYEARLKPLLETKILEQWKRIGQGAAARHQDPTQLHTLNTAQDVGLESKKATDKVFGSWRVGPKLEAGTNLKDKYAKEDTEIRAMSAEEQLATAEWRVEKIIRTDKDVAKLNDEHNVDRSRATEEGLISGVKKALASSHEAKLLDIQRAWPASADPAKGEVYLQLFKGQTKAADRAALWRMFMTLVHEYLHTLEHTAWRTWRDAEAKKDGSKDQTLREGVTEFLTRVVLADVKPSDLNLRQRVEGASYDAAAGPFDLKRTGYQADAERAEKLVGIVGVSNVYAAYFLGQTKLVGG